MRMNHEPSGLTEREVELFHEKITSIPHWVRLTEDTEKYVRHLHYRLYQKELQINALYNCLECLHPHVYTALVENDCHLIYGSSKQLDIEYNKR